VLYGTSYWSGLIDWLRTSMISHGTISAADLDLLHISDDVDEIVSIVRESQHDRSPGR
jgi:predicted Rossmann-fold nucleotide-binding protein